MVEGPQEQAVARVQERYEQAVARAEEAEANLRIMRLEPRTDDILPGWQVISTRLQRDVNGNRLQVRLPSCRWFIYDLEVDRYTPIEQGKAETPRDAMRTLDRRFASSEAPVQVEQPELQWQRDLVLDGKSVTVTARIEGADIIYSIEGVDAWPLPSSVIHALARDAIHGAKEAVSLVADWNVRNVEANELEQRLDMCLRKQRR